MQAGSAGKAGPVKDAFPQVLNPKYSFYPRDPCRLISTTCPPHMADRWRPPVSRTRSAHAVLMALDLMSLGSVQHTHTLTHKHRCHIHSGVTTWRPDRNWNQPSPPPPPHTHGNLKKAHRHSADKCRIVCADTNNRPANKSWRTHTHTHTPHLSATHTHTHHICQQGQRDTYKA